MCILSKKKLPSSVRPSVRASVRGAHVFFGTQLIFFGSSWFFRQSIGNLRPVRLAKESAQSEKNKLSSEKNIEIFIIFFFWKIWTFWKFCTLIQFLSMEVPYRVSLYGSSIQSFSLWKFHIEFLSMEVPYRVSLYGSSLRSPMTPARLTCLVYVSTVSQSYCDRREHIL